MRPLYDFTMVATPAVPAEWTYRKPISGAPVNWEDRPDAHAEHVLFYSQVVVDVEVLFADCDDGVNVEWKVRLRPNETTIAKHPYTVRFGYIDRATLDAQGPRRYDMAMSMAQQSLTDVFPWREERVKH